MATSLPTLSPLASAIAIAEGFGVGSNVPTLANNPGDLENGDVGYGTIAAAGGNNITVYGSVEDGWQALENQLNKIYNGTSSNYTPSMSLDQFAKTYSGGSATYGQNLANNLGVDPSTPLSALPNAPTSASAAASGGSLASKVASAVTSPSLFSLSRAIILILGVILFGAGLFAFKQTQTVIQTGTKAAKGGAKAIGAIAAI